MNQTEQAVLRILAETMNDRSRPLKGDQDWAAIYEELKNQALVPLTYSWVKNHGISDEAIAERWRVVQFQQFARWHQMMKEQRDLVELLQSHNYAVAILKGTANGVNYPAPQFRISSDIDFLVRWEEYDELYDFMIAHGYKLLGEKIESKHHIEFYKNGIVFEMHKRPGGTRLGGDKSNQEMIDFFQDGLNYIEHVTVGTFDVPVLPKLQTALVLLMHTSQHMKEGLGLRHILDWMMFAKENVDDKFWKKELKPMAEKAHVASLAKITTKMCQKYLGLTRDITWCKNADEYLCDQLMEYVFQQGDFGIKVKDQENELRILTDSEKQGGFLKRTIDSSLYSLPAAKKHPILRPIAFIYQLIRYTVQWLHRDHPLRTYLDNRKKAKKRSRFFDELGVKRD